MMKKIFIFVLLGFVYLFAKGDAPLVFEDTPVIDGVHKKVYHHKKHIYKKRYKSHKIYKRFRSKKNDALVAKDELILPN